MLLLALPIYWISFYSDASLTLFDFAALLLFSLGFYFEAVGDFQLAQFKKTNKGGVMREGLWRYTRHPNYFGESLIWWGIFVLAVSTPDFWYVLISPVTITFLLLKVSGVTMLEKKYKGDKKYQDYIESTNAFIPWFPKK